MVRQTLLVCWLLSGPAAWAQALEAAAAPRAETGAWATPIVQTFIQVGTNRINSLGQHSLGALSQLILTSTRRIDPAAFGRLAESLVARGLTPETFGALSAPEKESALKHASAAAESTAEAEALDILSRVPEKITADAAARLESELAPLAADDIYLSPERREGASAALRLIADFKTRRNDELAAWWRDTPLKIHEGSFDGQAHIVKTESGWRIGEHAPTQDAYPSYASAFAARMTEIEAMPDGPWKKQAFSELIHNVLTPSISKAAEMEGANASSLLEQAKKSQERIAADGVYAHPGLKKQGFWHIIAMAKHYNALARHPRLSTPDSWRMFSAFLKGDKEHGYPPYDNLVSDLKSATARAEKNNSLIVATLCYGLLPAFLIAAIAQVQVFLFAGLLAVIAGFLAFAMVYHSREFYIPSLHPDFEHFSEALDAARKARETPPG